MQFHTIFTKETSHLQHAALDPELILQQAMVEVGLPIDVANNQPLIEEPLLLDMDCEICGVAGNRRTQVFIPCGHTFCANCADRIEIWPGTEDTCPMEGRCHVCRTPVALKNRVYLY